MRTERSLPAGGPDTALGGGGAWRRYPARSAAPFPRGELGLKAGGAAARRRSRCQNGRRGLSLGGLCYGPKSAEVDERVETATSREKRRPRLPAAPASTPATPLLVGEAPALLLGQHGSRCLKAAEDRPARGKEGSAQARGWPRRTGSGAAGSGCRGAGQAGGLPGPEARAFRAPASANGRRPPAGGQWAGALGYKCRRRRALATARWRGLREGGGDC